MWTERKGVRGMGPSGAEVLQNAHSHLEARAQGPPLQGMERKHPEHVHVSEQEHRDKKWQQSTPVYPLKPARPLLVEGTGP